MVTQGSPDVWDVLCVQGTRTCNATGRLFRSTHVETAEETWFTSEAMSHQHNPETSPTQRQKLSRHEILNSLTVDVPLSRPGLVPPNHRLTRAEEGSHVHARSQPAATVEEAHGLARSQPVAAVEETHGLDDFHGLARSQPVAAVEDSHGLARSQPVAAVEDSHGLARFHARLSRLHLL